MPDKPKYEVVNDWINQYQKNDNSIDTRTKSQIRMVLGQFNVKELRYISGLIDGVLNRS